MQSVAEKQSKYLENLSQMIWFQKGFYESPRTCRWYNLTVLYKQKYTDNLTVSFPFHSDDVECVAIETE